MIVSSVSFASFVSQVSLVSMSLACSPSAPAEPSAETSSPPDLRAAADDDETPEPEPDPTWKTARDVAKLAAQERYEDALALIESRQAVDPDPAYTFMRATVEERRGRCEEAVSLYRAFARLDVSAEDREAAAAGVRRCGAGLEPDLPPPPPPDVGSSEDLEGEVSPPPSKAIDTPRPWYRDPAGMTLTTAGVAGLAVGSGLWVQAALDTRRAGRAADLGSFRVLDARSDRFEIAGIVTVAVGAALAVGGAIRLALVAGRAPRSPVAVGPWGVRARF